MHTSGGIAKYVTGHVQVLPDDQGLDSTKLKRLQCIIDTEAVPARVHADLVEILLDQLLLLYELDVGKGFGG
jgi:hypothetical protein